MKALILDDINEPGDFRVEAFDADGGCEVAIFSGPRARFRAIAFARLAYEEVEDRTTPAPR